MTKEELMEYCLNKAGAYEDRPFDPDYPVVKVRATPESKGKIFAEIFTLRGEDKLTFSLNADDTLALREIFKDVIVKGWHCPPVQAVYKSTVNLNAIDDELLLKLVDNSYNYVVGKMPKYLQKILLSK